MSIVFKAVRKLRSFRLLKAVAGPLRTNTYLILSTSNAEAVLIDAPPGVWEALCPMIKDGISLKWILLTHGHFDHTAEAKLLREKTGTSVAMHPADIDLFQISASVAKEFGIYWINPEITKYVMGDEFLNLIIGLKVKALHTPGHTPGSLIYHLPEFSIAFTGDTLFKGVVGATNFPGGSPERMKESLKKLFKEVPLDTVIYPGHGRETTLREELTSNEFVKRVVLAEKD